MLNIPFLYNLLSQGVQELPYRFVEFQTPVREISLFVIRSRSLQISNYLYI